MNNLNFYILKDAYFFNYTNRKVFRKKSIKDIYKEYSKLNFNVIFIESKFNGIMYPFYDLDADDKYTKIKEILDKPYALFNSSDKYEHYWLFVDDERFKNIKELFNDNQWLCYNDQNFLNATKESKKLVIRGLYNKLNKKPKLLYIDENASDNFKLFINKLDNFYKNEGLELSSLKYKDPEMYNFYIRKKKLQKITEE